LDDVFQKANRCGRNKYLVDGGVESLSEERIDRIKAATAVAKTGVSVGRVSGSTGVWEGVIVGVETGR
jgi:hypothetical protein